MKYATSEPDRGSLLKRILIAIVAVYLVVLLIILGINMSRGEPLSYQMIDYDNQSALTVDRATCEQYHAGVISTAYLWDEFVSDCELTTDLTYDATFFESQVLILQFYVGSPDQVPFTYYDYLFSRDGYEIINVRYERCWRSCSDETVKHIYLITIDKDEILGANILFD